VALVGRPNVGKSTMLNFFLRENISIVSPRPQTTRHRILGVISAPEAQVAFLDTPGFHQPEHKLGRYMMEVTKGVIEEADVLVAVIDARAGVTREDERVFAAVRQARRHRPRTALLALNKVDLVSKPRLLPLIDAAASTKIFDECIPVSAATGEQMSLLLERLMAYLPEGPAWYEPDQKTDQPPEQRVRELVREQVLLATRQEVPHAVAVRIDQVEERPNVTVIQATIVVERPGQKAIVIGKGGSNLKKIGQEARRHIERLLGRKLHLGLWVKVAENWREDERLLRQLGYSGQPEG
jgi:GTP-binding protein Era